MSNKSTLCPVSLISSRVERNDHRVVGIYRVLLSRLENLLVTGIASAVEAGLSIESDTVRLPVSDGGPVNDPGRERRLAGEIGGSVAVVDTGDGGSRFSVVLAIV